MSATSIEQPPGTPPPIVPRIKPKSAPPFPAWCQRTTVGLTVKKKALSFPEWQRLFEAADTTGRGHQWWIGDALNEGEQRFPEEYAQAIDPIDEAQRENEGTGETYRKYQQVACRFPIGLRRPKLYFGHHRVVAFMPHEEREHWLDLAEAEKWSVHKLEAKIKRAAEGGDVDAPADDLKVLQDPELRQLLGDLKVMVGIYDDKLEALIKKRKPDLDGARFLHRMTRAGINDIDRQLERDVPTDCKVVKKAIAAQLSPSLPAIEHEMRVRHYFMSTADLKDRLDLMEGMGVIIGERAENQRVADARGDTEYEYKIVRQPGETAADDDDDILW